MENFKNTTKKKQLTKMSRNLKRVMSINSKIIRRIDTRTKRISKSRNKNKTGGKKW